MLHCQPITLTLTNRAQLIHATNLPILTANRRMGEGKGGGRVLHCCHPRCPRYGTINIIILGRSSAGQRAQTGNTSRLKNSQLKYSRPEEMEKLRKERNSTKMHEATTETPTAPGENEMNKPQKDKSQLKTKKQK